MFGLFKKVRNRPAAAAPTAPRVAPRTSASQPSAAPDDPLLRHFCEIAGVDLAFTEVLHLLALQPAVPEPLTPEETEGDEALAHQLLQRIEKDGTGPNAFPANSLRVLNLVASPNADINELIRLVRQDGALCASLLKVVNSAAHRGLSEVESIREAVTRMGLTEVGRVAGIMSARTLFNPQVKAEFSLFGPLWSQQFHDSSLVAWGAAGLALQVPSASADRVFLGGILHDVGKSVALRALAQEILAGTLSAQVDPRRIERVLHAVHLDVGKRVHETWALPEGIKPICNLHHQEHLVAGPETIDILVVRVVSSLLALRKGTELTLRAAHELWSGAQALQLSPHAIRALNTELKKHESQAELMGQARV
jgi:HD-like signal output (HDOD) protein